MTDIRWYQMLALWKSSCSWRATTGARSPAPPTTRTCKTFGEAIVELAERAEALTR